ncbi:tRNA (Uracil-5-)-methyltransferase [Pleurostoma richardsiae]|uniref:tRNA (uracil(54)-C(5))-methyltransferase n=1 Tax=Pleurostoma richardsiae TaxID=41990 RepID=A0AA38VVX5_9PEZI|nr:tRNA (Uracil-5-)-methyltransferase [Pleurostoma richardsiae]
MKRPLGEAGGNQQKKSKKAKRKGVKEGSSEEVLLADIRSLLEAQKLSEPTGNGESTNEESPELTEISDLPEPGTEIEVEVFELSSTGDGLARQKGSHRIYVLPFAVPGDTIRVKVYRHLPNEQYSVADFISVTKPSPLRDDSRIQCKYFGRCSGCQFQMLDYAEQLRLKRTIVEKAFRNFSQLPPELIPQIQDTIGSPLQYNYRTKLTPHFDGPPGFHRRGRGKKQALQEVPEIGFMQKGTRKTLDIEDCPIGTEAVRKGMKRERERMAVDFGKYQRGATILLRESTQRVPKASSDEAEPQPVEAPADSVIVEADSYTDVKTCITDGNATSTEYIDSFVFTNPAGFFFQNNNSILPVFTSYIRENILPPPSPSAKPIRYLIDAYSGSGLFTITLSSLFPGGSTGIDIADKSIAFARRNAALNGLPEDQCRFIAADAPELFKSVAHYDPDETVVVLDPPRKGCDASFLRQLLRFGPRRVVYVSCNVHTQARDIGMLVRGEVDFAEDKDREEQEEGGEQKGDAVTTSSPGVRYSIESLRGFDFFPQTGHVEGVALLNRVDDAPVNTQEADAR